MVKYGIGLVAGITLAIAIGCGARHSVTQLGDDARALVAKAQVQLAAGQAADKPNILLKAQENLAKGDSALANGHYDQAKHWYQRAIVDADHCLATSPPSKQTAQR